MIAVAGDPLADIDVLHGGVVGVMQGGAIVRAP
jgi:hypothetical protein